MALGDEVVVLVVGWGGERGGGGSGGRRVVGERVVRMAAETRDERREVEMRIAGHMAFMKWE